MSRGPKSRVCAISIGLTLLFVPGAPQAVAAGSSCGSVNYNYFGYTRSPSGARASGAQANIEVRQADLCSGSASDYSGGFAGLFEQGSGDGMSWTGWTHTGTGRFVSVGHTPNTHGGVIEINVFPQLGTLGLGDVLKYKTSWETGGDGRLHNIVCAADGTNCNTVAGSTWQGSAWNDIQGRVAGSTDFNEADLPGTAGNRADYRSILWRDGPQAWGTASSNHITNGPNRYHLNDVDNTHLQTWTDPL